MSPLLDKVVQERSDVLQLNKIDADKSENEELLRDYDIRSIPTLLLVKDQQVIATLVGAVSERALNDWLDIYTGVNNG